MVVICCDGHPSIEATSTAIRAPFVEAGMTPLAPGRERGSRPDIPLLHHAGELGAWTHWGEVGVAPLVARHS